MFLTDINLIPFDGITDDLAAAVRIRGTRVVHNVAGRLSLYRERENKDIKGIGTREYIRFNP